MSEAREPPLKKVPTTIWSECQQCGEGVFSWILCAPKRPPRLEKASTGGSGEGGIGTGGVLAARARRLEKASTGGSGQVEIGTGCFSSRRSSSQTSLGQSAALLLVDSSVTTSRLRSNNGSTVWVKPV